MPAQDGLVGLHETIESSPSLEKEKGKKHYPAFHWKTQRSLSFRATKNAPHKDQDDMIPARTKVFATTELVYEILSHIPVGRLASARRVSKKWNTVIQKIGYHIDPVRVHTNSPNWPDSWPEYPDTVPIVFNPLFGRRPIYKSPSREDYVAFFQVDHLFHGCNRGTKLDWE